MLEKRDEQALKAARLYYETGLSQAGVAYELGVSRPTVSKLLAHARDSGFVTININDPREQADALIGQLRALYGIKDARIVRPASTSNAELINDLGSAGAAMLESLVHDDMTLGLSWGETMFAVAEHLRPTVLRGVHVVQLKGGHSHSERSTKDVLTLTRCAQAFNAEMDMLPVPVIFDNPEAKKMVEKDRHIAHILRLGATTDIAVFTVGDARPESLLMNLGYLRRSEISRLASKSVGDLCSRFFNKDGEIADEEINDRTVGITIENLKTRPIRLLVAGGANKTEAIRVALNMGMATHLVIDRDTATRVLAVD
ncbi:sugar-binding transcriptional regulator [Corynebacterium caspium]|uniref:sugar-binding transcriptional regulator n=1 Tax=Corynebacterium caspium TaxID=234828 RepID=UPI000381A79C|nr:sugar-binding transcriptional regulator [Corynebacterium caspium]WKD58465.1 Deoxyribonucleoside regulator [Corynebacterium caspium DSM 44850]